MENEIEKLKQIYLKTEVPVELEFYGFEDVLERIQGKSPNRFYLYRFVGFAILILILIGGFVGMTYASKPNSTLYAIKIAAQRAIADISHATPKKVEDSINNFIDSKPMVPTRDPQLPQSTPTPTSTPKANKELQKEEIKDQEDFEDTNADKSHEDVKGIGTSNVQGEVRQNNQQQEQVHNNSEGRSSNASNQENGSSQSHSDENSSSSSNSSKHAKD